LVTWAIPETGKDVVGKRYFWAARRARIAIMGNRALDAAIIGDVLFDAREGDHHVD
jgi:hypothetical protein